MTDPVRHISDTARWVAAFRALETERKDALFRDPLADRLAGAEGHRLARELPGGLSNAWGLVVRTKLLDDLIERLVAPGTAEVGGEGVRLVVNLAAGFDTRPYRLALPAELLWIEADFPDLVAEKNGLLGAEKPRCRLERVALDLSDTASRQRLLDSLGEAAETPGLVLTEGLLIYLAPEEVDRLAQDLAAAPALGLWALDLVNHRLLQILQRRWGAQLEPGNAGMKFGPRNRLEYFRRFGWHEREGHSLLEAGLRLGRPARLGGLLHWGKRALARAATPLPERWRAELPWGGVGLLAHRAH